MCLLYDGNSRRLNRNWFYGEAGNRTCDPWFTRHSAYPLHHEGGFLKKKFCGFSVGRNQYWAGRVYDLCVYYMTGTPEGSTESGFMEKPGIEPATPGLQGIALIHYTTRVVLWEITQTKIKGEQPFFHATHCLDLIYMYTKYHLNMSKGIRFIERTSIPL